MRLPAVQTSPWLKNTPNSAPSTAFSKSASAKKMFGDLPPSSSEIFFSVPAAARMISLPTSTLPVNAILSTSGMLDDRRARRLAHPGDDVDDAGRKAGIGEARGQREHRQRRLLGRLQHGRAAGAEGGRQLPRRHQQRVVPRDDLAGDADRLAQREAHRVVGNRQHVAVNLRGEAAVVLEAGRDVRDVVLRFDDRLAGVARLEIGELVGAVAHVCASLNSTRPRSCAVVVFQSPLSNAVRAAVTARSTSAALASGTRAITSDVAGSMTSSVAADSGLRIRRRYRGTVVFKSQRQLYWVARTVVKLRHEEADLCVDGDRLCRAA